MFYKNIPLVSHFEPTCKPILFGYLYISLPSLKCFPSYPLVLNCNGTKSLSGKEKIIYVMILGWKFKAKCGGVQGILIRVVLCPNYVCASEKKIVKNTCVEKKK